MNNVFAMANVNGNWSLFVYDDNGATSRPNAPGSVAGGWGLELLAPTAANASLEGRVKTADGRGIKGAVVTIQGGGLTEPLVARSGPFGYYRFENLPAGQLYTLSVATKRYRFDQPTLVVSLVDNLADVNFVAQPEP